MNLLLLRQILLDGTYKTSEYSTFKIYEPKERLIFRLPYYPDRIVHHAIMNVVEPIWVKQFINNTYSCIKGRGIHKCMKDVRKVLDGNPEGTKYCLKLDVTKFYPSIDHDILKKVVRKKIKDKRLLDLLDSIIDSANGVPIGNYLSQFFANLYLSDFDHWVKEVLQVKYYFRYADDIVLLGEDKDLLRWYKQQMETYLNEKLLLQIKPNYQIFPVDTRGLDFVGYKFYHTHTKLRKSIKNSLFKCIHNNKNSTSLWLRLSSYFGWMKYCNSKNLLRKITDKYNVFFSNWNGKLCKMRDYYNKFIFIIHKWRCNKHYRISFIRNKQSCILKTRDSRLFNALEENKIIKLCNI